MRKVIFLEYADIILQAAQLHTDTAVVSRHSFWTACQNHVSVTRHNQFFGQTQFISSDSITLLLCWMRNDSGVFCKRIKIHKGVRGYDLGDCYVFLPELPLIGLSEQLLSRSISQATSVEFPAFLPSLCKLAFLFALSFNF